MTRLKLSRKQEEEMERRLDRSVNARIKRTETIVTEKALPFDSLSQEEKRLVMDTISWRIDHDLRMWNKVKPHGAVYAYRAIRLDEISSKVSGVHIRKVAELKSRHSVE